MVRCNSFESIPALRAPLIAAVLAAGLMVPAAGRAGDIRAEPSRPVIALGTARDETAAFMQLFAATDTGETGVRGMVRRALGVPRSSSPQSSGLTADKPGAPVRHLMVADADPYFERWQKDANEKLKEEAVVRTVKQHPFALANPDKMVVVCEAGCRTPKDEIVYIAALVPAVEPPRKFDPSLSGQAPAPVDDGNMPCIAGCYEKPERNKPAAPRRTAEVMPAQAPSQHAVQPSRPTITGAITPVVVAKAVPKVRNRQIGHSGAIIDQPAAPALKAVRRAASKPKPGTVAGKMGSITTWRAKVFPAKVLPAKVPAAKVQRAEGWTTTVAKAPPVLKRVKATHRFRPTLKGAQGGPWRTKIVFEQEARALIRH